MGLFGFLSQQNNITDSILPPAAKSEIMSGRLPIMNTTNVFLRSGEFCCYIDKAILNVDKEKKIYHHTGAARKGLFGDYRINYGRGFAQEYKETEQFKGILYITNKRMIFQAKENGFDKPHSGLTAIDPYSNAVILQYGSNTYTLIVADGSVINAVLKQVV